MNWCRASNVSVDWMHREGARARPGEWVKRQMDKWLPPMDHIVIMASSRYREFLIDYLRHRARTIRIPVRGLGIGRQRQHLTKALAQGGGLGWGRPVIAEHKRIMKLLKRLNAQPQHTFPSSRERLAVPNTHGVYIIRDDAGEVWHVGRTVRGKDGLRQRLRNHLQGQSSFVRAEMHRDGKKLRKGFTFQYLEVPDDRTRALLESLAVAAHCPRHIGLGRRLAG